MHVFMICVCLCVRPEASSRAVFGVELLVTEGSQMDISTGWKHQTWRENLQKTISSNTIRKGRDGEKQFCACKLLLPLGLSHFLACMKLPMSVSPSNMYPIGSEMMTSTMSGQITSSASPSRTVIRSERQLLSTRIYSIGEH